MILGSGTAVLNSVLVAQVARSLSKMVVPHWKNRTDEMRGLVNDNHDLILFC